MTNSTEPLHLLNQLVKRDRITVRELGKILGIDHSAAARILQGKRGITVKHAKTLAAIFGISASAFLGIDDDPGNVIGIKNRETPKMSNGYDEQKSTHNRKGTDHGTCRSGR
jgi:transcriptional regulator with XRE-family HTH domain